MIIQNLRTLCIREQEASALEADVGIAASAVGSTEKADVGVASATMIPLSYSKLQRKEV